MGNAIKHMKFIRLIIAICYLYLIFLTHIMAQTLQDTLIFSEVIIKASPINQTVFKSPFSVSVISKADLNRSDGAMLTPLLNSVAGVQMQQGNWNTNRITIRGQGARSQFSTNRIKAYLNEIPLSSSEGETILEDIDLNNIQNIEIIKGPNGTAFGAGTGGVIRIETNQALENNQVTLFSQSGRFGLQRTGINAKLKLKNWHNVLAFNHQTIEGFRENSNFRRSQLYWQSDMAINQKNNLKTLVLLTDVKAFIPSTINQIDFDNNPSLAASNWRAAQGYEAYQRMIVGATHEYKSHNEWQLKNTLFSQVRVSDEPRPFDIIDDQLGILGIRLVAQKKLTMNQHQLNFSFGTEAISENYKLTLFRNLYQQFPNQGSIRGDAFANTEQNRHYLHLFSQVQWQTDNNWQAEFGLAYNTSNYQILAPEKTYHSFGDVFLPRLAISKYFNQQHHVFGSVSRGFAVPTLSESLTVEGNFNNTLLPESALSYELGYKWQSANTRWQSSIALYRMPVNQLLVARRIAEDQFEGRNAGSSLHQGVEWEGQYRLKINHHQRVKFFGAITYNDFRFVDFLDFEVRHDGNFLPAVPQWQTSMRVVWQINSKWELSVNHRFTDRMPLNDGNTLFNEAFQVVDILTQYQFNLKKTRIHLNTGINNLFNTQYAASVLPNAVGFGNALPRYFYPGLPFQWHFGLRLQFPD